MIPPVHLDQQFLMRRFLAAQGYYMLVNRLFFFSSFAIDQGIKYGPTPRLIGLSGKVQELNLWCLLREH
jgi:hypothetical protein